MQGLKSRELQPALAGRGTGFTGCGKTRCWVGPGFTGCRKTHVLYQGTTSVVPKKPQL
jgi:hypothetical protein